MTIDAYSNDPIDRSLISQIHDGVDETVAAMLLGTCPSTAQTLTWTFVGRKYCRRTICAWANPLFSSSSYVLTTIGMEKVAYNGHKR